MEWPELARSPRRAVAVPNRRGRMVHLPALPAARPGDTRQTPPSPADGARRPPLPQQRVPSGRVAPPPAPPASRGSRRSTSPNPTESAAVQYYTVKHGGTADSTVDPATLSRTVADHCAAALSNARGLGAPQSLLRLCLTCGDTVIWQAAALSRPLPPTQPPLATPPAQPSAAPADAPPSPAAPPAAAPPPAPPPCPAEQPPAAPPPDALGGAPPSAPPAAPPALPPAAAPDAQQAAPAAQPTANAQPNPSVAADVPAPAAGRRPSLKRSATTPAVPRSARLAKRPAVKIVTGSDLQEQARSAEVCSAVAEPPAANLPAILSPSSAAEVKSITSTEDYEAAPLLPHPPGTDEDAPGVSLLRMRASKAYRRIVGSYKKDITHLKGALDKTQMQCEHMKRGGTAYAALMKERDWLQKRCMEAVQKVKDLLELLARAGEQLEQLEARNAEMARALDAPQKLDWSVAKKYLEDISIVGRRDEDILADWVTSIAQLHTQYRDMSMETESSRLRMGDIMQRMTKAEALVDDLRGELLEVKGERTALSQELNTVRTMQQRDSARLEELQRKMEPLELENCALRDQILHLKGEMSRALSANTKNHFVGLGKLKSVPVYLRYTGKLNNLGIEKGALESFISALWNTRQQEWLAVAVPSKKEEPASATAGRLKQRQPVGARALLQVMRRWDDFDTYAALDYGNVPIGVSTTRIFPEFVHAFVTDKHKTPGDWAYSMMDACSRFKYDADVELFHRILTGDLPEDAYYDQTMMIEKFRMFLLQEEIRRGPSKAESRLDPDAAGDARGKGTGGLLPPFVILDCLQRFFPAKSQQNHANLRAALCDDIGLPLTGTPADVTAIESAPDVKHADLFASDAKGNQGQFVEALRDQYVEEVMTHTAEMLQCIQAADGQGCPEGHVLLCVVKFQVLLIDDKPEKDVDRWLWLLTRDTKQQWPGHHIARGEVRWHEPYDAAKLTERARKLLCKRHGARPKDAAARTAELLTWIDLPDEVAEKASAAAEAAAGAGG